MVALLVAALVVPWSRTFFALTFPRPLLWLAGIGVAGLAGLALEGGWLLAGSASDLAGQYQRRRTARANRRSLTDSGDGRLGSRHDRNG